MNGGKQTGVQMTVVPGLYLDFLPAEWRENERDYFGYGITAANILAGTTQVPTFSVQADSMFLLTQITGTARDPAAPAVRFPNPALALQIDSGGSGRNMFSQAVHWDTVVGDAQLPYFLPYPKLFEPRAVVNVTMANLDAAQAYDVRITFGGFKIFNYKRL